MAFTYGGAPGKSWNSEAEFLQSPEAAPVIAARAAYAQDNSGATTAPGSTNPLPPATGGGGGGNIPPAPGGSPLGGLAKAAPAAASGGAGPTGMATSDPETPDIFSGPNTMRQGIGQRNPPNLSPILTGLRSIY